MTSANSPEVECEDTKLPSWLANHLNIEWNSDDVDALLTSIDASQHAKTSTTPLLPAELLLLIIERVPAEHVLDWRLVCRGFRDAIDGRVLFYHLQRTQLVGYLGSRTFATMTSMSDKAYEELSLLFANFSCLVDGGSKSGQAARSALWESSHAVFTFDPQWARAHQYHEHREGIPSRVSLLNRLNLSRNDQAYGALTWAIQLGASVLDLDFPLEVGRQTFDITIDTEHSTIRVEWKPMLFRFLKTERALRLLMEKKSDSAFSFSHAEDCLRAVRRQRLHAALDPDNKIDRHIKWSLRLLQPLWGVSGHKDPSTLAPSEHSAARVLLLLRRTAALSAKQIAHLEQLSEDYNDLVSMMNGLARSVQTVQSQLVRRSQQEVLYHEVPQQYLESQRVPINPITWPDSLRADIESRVQKWRAQRDVLEQMQALMVVSQEALAVPEDAFDMMDSDF